jgi:flagella basal body P-ring formation protein FlgA
MSFALGLAFAAAAGFADLDAIDRQVEAFTGAPVGQPGGASTPVDRRLRLHACAAPLAVDWNGARRDSLVVRCPAAGGWRIFVQLSSASVGAGMAGAAAMPAVSRGDAVTIAVQGDGFSVSQPGEALEGGPIGAWIRVRPAGSTRGASARGETMRAQIVRPGMVAIPLP